MRVIKFLLENAVTGEVYEENLPEILASRVVKRLKASKTESEKEEFLTSTLSILSIILEYIKKDSKICEIHSNGELSKEEKKKLDAILPEDEFVKETVDNIIKIVENEVENEEQENLLNQLKLMLQLKVSE